IADDLLGVALRVAVGGVDEVAAAREKAIEDRLGVLHGRTPAPLLAERHGAEAERGHAEAGATKRHVVIECHAASIRPPLPSGGTTPGDRSPGRTPACART